MAPSDMEKQVMLAGMCPRFPFCSRMQLKKISLCSDILDVAKAGIEFYEHQRNMEVMPLAYSNVRFYCLVWPHPKLSLDVENVWETPNV